MNSHLHIEAHAPLATGAPRWKSAIHSKMSKKKVRTSQPNTKHSSKHSHRSSCRSPSPEHFDASGYGVTSVRVLNCPQYSEHQTVIELAIYLFRRRALPLHYPVPLTSLISNHEALATAAVSFVGWKSVESMLPPCLQGRSSEDVILLVADELDCMSKRRITRILQGEVVPSDSSSSEVSGEDGDSDIESRRNSFADQSDQNSVKSNDCTPNLISRSSHSEVDHNEAERECFSDIELVEGLDEEVDNLPDVSKT